ncbi:hypothetical protein CHUAL_000136 [Chamberlinius hualienensis]
MSTLDTLLEMGFTKSKSERALAATDNQGVEAAMEWLLAHSEDLTDEPMEVATVENVTGDDVEEAQSAAVEEASNAAGIGTLPDEAASQVAKSLKCDECGKLFNSDIEVEFHAVKSGHQSFSESVEEKKALTEEEKRDHLKKLEEKIKSRRLAKEEDQKKEQIEKEKMRRRTGQQIVEAKKRMEEEEIRRLAELKRREKAEEKLAKQRILEQIEMDKEARKKKFPNTAGSPSNVSVVAPAPIEPPNPPSVVSSAEKKEYTRTKLQVRLTNGSTLSNSFGIKESLSAVRLYIEMHRTDGQSAFNLMTSFPRKVFTDEDMEKPLFELGLVPSAVLILTKTN